jgi:hypothetical protein
VTALIVPIDVAALCVGRPDTQGDDHGGPAVTLAPIADFSGLPYAAGGKVHNRGPYVSVDVLAEGGPFAGERALGEGIHLHWALPDGLTHARHGADHSAPLDFPAVPDRWLVTRILVDASAPARSALTSWVVESDRLGVTPSAPSGVAQPTVPTAPTPGQNFRYIGQAFPLASWAEQAGAVERLAPLTALGYGEPTFAALYTNSSTVFGFLDTLADVTDLDPARTTVTYHVAGWYAAPGADPLAGVAVDPRANRYDWRWSGAQVPAETVCSGVIDGISWDPARAYLNEQAQPLSVALASTAAEAISALCAAVLDPERFPGAEMLLNALQFGLLARQGEVDGLERLAEAIHAGGFARLNAGLRWEVSDAATATPATVTADGDADADPLPEGLARDLAELNERQQALDALVRELASRREQLFADWHKYLLVTYRPADVPAALRGQGGQVADRLETAVAEITAMTRPGGAIERAAGGIAALADALGGRLRPKLALAPSTDAPRHYRPVDPIVLLAGPDAAPATRHAARSRLAGDGLPCRLDGEVVDAVALAADLVPGSAAVALAATALPGLSALPGGAPAGLLERLLREAILLAPAAAPVVCAAVAAAGGSANPALLDVEATGAALARAATAFVAGQADPQVTHHGSPPDPTLLADWSGTPWLPVRLDWEIEFAPVQFIDPAAGDAPYPPDFLDRFELAADAVELAYAGALPARTQSYSGVAILTPAATVNLTGELERYLQRIDRDDPELAAILADLRGLPVLAQRLTGALEAMLMRDLVLQMPVSDPLAPPPEAFLSAAVAAAVARETALAPLPENSFNPIRAGAMRVRRLRLVDVFGRVRDYVDPAVVVARGLSPPTTTAAPLGTAFLPPRIAQPARLQFRWLAAAGLTPAEAASADPATTPIAGWLRPIWPDRAIAVHRADGTALGDLAVSSDGARVLWTPAPGGRFRPRATIDEVLAGENAELRGFGLAAHNGGDATFLAPFLNAVHDALSFALPSAYRESAEAAVLAGQPLALARASIGLELAGPPAVDQSWTSFAAQVLDGAPADDGGVSAVRFPVRLGSLTRLDDTLVGYWVSLDGVTDYGRFYMPAAKAAGGGVQPPQQDTITLTPTGPTDASTVTILLDPRGSVHASTGVLPVKAIRIPRELYAGALRGVVPVLATRPVLSGDGLLRPRALTLPKLSDGAWSWIGVDGEDWVSTAVIDARSEATLDFTPQRILEGWLRPDTEGGERR